MQKRTFKTKRTLSGIKTEFHAWAEWAEGDTLIAKLIGTAPNQKNKTKKNWIVEVVEPQFDDKKQNKRLKPGTKLTLNSAGQLDKGMEQLEVGSLFQVVYNGSKEMEGGDYAGEQAHTMEVTEVEEDNGEEEVDDEDLDEEDGEDSDDEDSEDEEEDEHDL